MKPYITKGYFRKGSKPIVKYSHHPSQKVCVFGGLTEDGFTGMTAEIINKFSFKKFIQRLYYKYRKIVIVLDRASWHRAKIVKDYITNRDIILIYLPSYSPELNPTEQSWKKLKKLLGTVIWESVDELKRIIITTLRQSRITVKMYDYLCVTL